MDKNTLQHAGIKGMRWGVRRYQNKDGSLTPEGKKRYGVDDDSDNHEDYKRARNKSVRKMTDAELRTALNRVQMEQQYAQLTAVQKSAGRKWVEGVLADTGKNIATKTLSAVGQTVVNTLLDNAASKAKKSGTKDFVGEILKNTRKKGVGNHYDKDDEDDD